MISELTLLAGVDIPFVEAKLVIHPPTLKEIAYIGEERFFMGCELLRFSKKSLKVEDQLHLENQSDFDIIMTMMNDRRNLGSLENSRAALEVLTLLFPSYTIQIEPTRLVLTNEQAETGIIDNKNYHVFRQILLQIFCLDIQGGAEYNPGGAAAQRIADKLRRGKARVAQQKGTKQKVSVFSRYASILAVGECKDLSELMNYTVYQLFDEFNRYQLKEEFDITVKAKMAGAKNVKNAEDWRKDIHSDEFLSE